LQKAILLLYRQLILRIRQDIVDLLRVIEDETGLTFDAIIADIHAGKYGEVCMLQQTKQIGLRSLF
jgi:hypothetical protein